jgi:hydroxymethylbilane synthase
VIAVQAREGSEAADVAVGAGHARTMAWLTAERAVVREFSASCHTPVGIHATSVTVRAFAGLPDGSQWLVDEVAVEHEDVVAAADELARRMLAAGVEELLHDAEEMATR